MTSWRLEMQRDPDLRRARQLVRRATNARVDVDLSAARLNAKGVPLHARAAVGDGILGDLLVGSSLTTNHGLRSIVAKVAATRVSPERTFVFDAPEAATTMNMLYRPQEPQSSSSSPAQAASTSPASASAPSTPASQGTSETQQKMESNASERLGVQGEKTGTTVEHKELVLKACPVTAFFVTHPGMMTAGLREVLQQLEDRGSKVSKFDQEPRGQVTAHYVNPSEDGSKFPLFWPHDSPVQPPANATLVKPGDVIQIGNEGIEVVQLHTAPIKRDFPDVGHVGYLFKKQQLLFTGDTLYPYDLESDGFPALVTPEVKAHRKSLISYFNDNITIASAHAYAIHDMLFPLALNPDFSKWPTQHRSLQMFGIKAFYTNMSPEEAKDAQASEEDAQKIMRNLRVEYKVALARAYPYYDFQVKNCRRRLLTALTKDIVLAEKAARRT